MRTAPLLALIAAFAAPASVHGMTAEPTRLTLTFETGAESGAVMVSLFDSEAAYGAGGEPIRHVRVDVERGERTVVFADLPEGAYALKAFHDVNGDGRMNTNPFGIPTEPFAFSNNARGNMGPAAWDRARFTVSGETIQTIQIR